MNGNKSDLENRREFVVTDAQQGRRLDRALAEADPDRSRSQIQREIAAKRVTVDGRIVTQASTRLRADQCIAWTVDDTPDLTPTEIPVSVLYEDDHIVVVDKPIGMVVHPGAGTTTPTLVEALLAERDLPQSDNPVRPGIVHRLDKETSGVIVVAKTAQALTSLKQQFAEREVQKAYLAWVDGTFNEDEGEIDAPVTRDPVRPRRMCVHGTGREARTLFRVLEKTDDRSYVLAQPRTGRTHQIRVHFSYIGHPVVGDTLYGGPPAERMMLHAWTLSLVHPATMQRVTFEASPPEAFPTPPER